jgi:hypothetical protein
MGDFMKTLVIGLTVAAVLSGAAVASDRIKVVYGSGQEDFTVDDRKTTSVCALKKMVADKYDLKLKEFDLIRGSSNKLNEDKTLHAAGVWGSTKVYVKIVNYSYQCD